VEDLQTCVEPAEQAVKKLHSLAPGRSPAPALVLPALPAALISARQGCGSVISMGSV